MFISLTTALTLGIAGVALMMLCLIVGDRLTAPRRGWKKSGEMRRR